MADTSPVPPKPTTVATVLSTTESLGELGCTKRKWMPRKQQANELNSCLCGDVIELFMEGVLKCKQAGCETEWITICFFITTKAFTH